MNVTAFVAVVVVVGVSLQLLLFLLLLLLLASLLVSSNFFVSGDVDVVTSASDAVSVDFWSCSYWC